MAIINVPNVFGPISNPIQDFLNGWSSNWGIFDQTGQPLTGFGLSLIGASQSVFSFGYNKETFVSNFPVEQGGFATYNKVELPANPIVVLNLTGNESDRTQFLDSIAAACQSTDLYTIITPEVQYVDYTLQTFNYSRSAFRGTTLISVNIILQEVIQISNSAASSSTSINNPSDPANFPSVSSGKVQPQIPSNQVQKAVTTGLSN